MSSEVLDKGASDLWRGPYRKYFWGNIEKVKKKEYPISNPLWVIVKHITQGHFRYLL